MTPSQSSPRASRSSARASQSSPKAPPDPPTSSPRASPSYAALWGGSGGVRARFESKNIWFSHNLELVADFTGAAEVVARPAGRTPRPTCAGGQDDGSYTNSLKQKLAHHVHNETQGVYSFREKYQTKGLNISVLLDGANDP